MSSHQLRSSGKAVERAQSRARAAPIPVGNKTSRFIASQQPNVSGEKDTAQLGSAESETAGSEDIPLQHQQQRPHSIRWAAPFADLGAFVQFGTQQNEERTARNARRQTRRAKHPDEPVSEDEDLFELPNAEDYEPEEEEEGLTGRGTRGRRPAGQRA